MKVLQIPFCFYPDPVGGTEIYVEALSKNLLQKEVQILIAAPGNANESYFCNQLPVRRFAISQEVERLEEMYGEGDKQSASEFCKILDEEQPDIVHLHAFTRGVSLRLVQAAKQRNIPVIFTYHTPTVSCQRGTLLKWGEQVCDGKLNLHTCSKCTLHGLGLNHTRANIVGSLPSLIGQALGTVNLQGGIWTALRMTELVSYRFSALHTLFFEVDRIVAVCNWIKDVLICNDVPADKITVNRQGLCQEIPTVTDELKKNDIKYNSCLKIAFLGRMEPTKGIDILLKAFQATPQLMATLDIYGILQNSSSNIYQKQLLDLVEGDPRISFKSSVPASQVVDILSHYDLLAVPSQWLETGPLVILEAFAAGIPVIGSNLGGIAELVQHEVNGLLVEPASIEAWCQELQRLSEDKDLLKKLKSNIYLPRHIKSVAEEMLQLYDSILS